MRRYLLVLVLLALVVMPAQAQSDDAIIIGTLDLPNSLDPALAGDFVRWEVLSHLYTGLTRQVPGTNDYELALATEHQISEDGLRHTFSLRQDTTFTDGTPITAETFEQSIERVIDLDRDGASIIKPLVDSVDATDEYVLEFELHRPVPYFQEIVARAPFFAVHPDDFPADDVVRNISPLIGNGVYILDSFEQSERIELVANPDYQFGTPARTHRIILTDYEDTESLRLALVKNEVDVAWRDVRLPDAVSTANEHSNVIFASTPSLRMWYLYINSDPRFEDTTRAEVRLAIAGLIDRDRIVDTYFDNQLQPAYSLLPAMFSEAYTPLWNPPLTGEEAIAILQEADYRPYGEIFIGFRTAQSLYGDYYTNALRNINRDLIPIGTYITINQFELDTDRTVFLDGLVEGDHHAALFAWTPVAAHPDAYLRPLLHSEGILAPENDFATDAIDQLLDEALASEDSELYIQAQQLAFEDHSLVPLWQDVTSILYRADISGVTIEANYFLHYDLLERN